MQSFFAVSDFLFISRCNVCCFEGRFALAANMFFHSFWTWSLFFWGWISFTTQHIFQQNSPASPGVHKGWWYRCRGWRALFGSRGRQGHGGTLYRWMAAEVSDTTGTLGTEVGAVKHGWLDIPRWMKMYFLIENRDLFINICKYITVYSLDLPPRRPVTNEGLGWDSWLT